MRNLTAGTNTDPQVYISHEIVELITNAAGGAANFSPGWISTSFCNAGNCELSDKCLVTTGVGNYTPAVGTNTWAASYYSNKGGGCTLPGIVTPNNGATNVFTNPGITGTLSDAHIVLLFWKTGWSFTNNTNPALGTADEIKRGVQNLISKTQYYKGLSEYGISSLTYDWAAINSTTPLPATFRDSDVQQAIRDSMNAGAIPIAGEQASGTPGSSIYIVIVDSSAQYVTGGVQGSHGMFYYAMPPPNNVPTTNPPVGSTPGMQADAFGVTQLYPSKAGGSSWVLPANPNSDAKHVVDATAFSTNADGSYKVTSPSVMYHIAANNGFTEASLTLNQATLNSQKYMQDSMDWTNVEMTCLYKINAHGSSSHNGAPHIEHIMRGAKDVNDSTILNGFPKSCEAADYHLAVYPGTGQIIFSKDLQHTQGITSSAKNPSSAVGLVPGGYAQWGNQFFGVKTICYTRSDGTSTKLEIWLDSYGRNQWLLYYEFVDQGNWGGGKPACGGTNNMVINWGGPLCKFRWDNLTDVDIKWASIREIDVYGQNPTTPSPPSNTPPTLDPTNNPPANLPPTPSPPNVQPPLPSYTGTKDRFGVTQLYPTRTAGETWFLSSNGLSGDPRVFITPRNDRETVNGDGSFHLQNNDDVMIDIATSQGYSFQFAGGLNINHKVCDARQYLMHPKDWKNVEITFFHSIDAVKTKGNSGRFDCDIRARHGSHSRHGDCQAAAYIAHIRCDILQDIKFAKRQWMEHRPDDDERHPRGIPGGYPYAQVLKRWVGRKLVVYNVVDPLTGRVTGVKLEHYWNDNGDGVTWKKLHETTDIGGWGDADDLCGGFKDQIITWGGPFVSFVWDDLINLSYKWLSVREIDTSGQSSPPGGPPNPSPGGGPPPGPPLINPIIGPNIYNVLKVVSSVITDDSGGCNIGIDLTKHKGQITLGTALGTNVNAKLGAAYNTRAGERCVNATSALYNQVIIEVDGMFSLVGIPAGTLSCVIRRGLDDTIVATIGTIQANQLSSAIQTVAFTNNAMPYTIASTDHISFEFNGGDASNYVLVYADSSNPFDTTNSDWFTYTSPTYTYTTTTDASGGWYSKGAGIQAVIKYNVPSQVGPPTNGPIFYLNNGGATKCAEFTASGSSQLIGLTLTELDVFLTKVGNPTGNVLVYILENSGLLPTYSFGTIDATLIPDYTLVGARQFNFINYANAHVNTGNTFVVVEYSGGDSSNSVGVSMNYTNPFDTTNTAAYRSQGGSWTQIDTGGVSPIQADMVGKFWGGGTPPPPGGPGAPPGSTGILYQVVGSSVGLPLISNANATIAGGGTAYAMVGEIANDSQSKLVGKIFVEVDVSLKKVGNPKGNIYCAVLSPNPGPPTYSGTKGEYVIFDQTPSLDLGNITTTYFTYKFLFYGGAAANRPTLVGDRIVFVMASNPVDNDQNNYVMIDMSNTDSFDGSHTVAIVGTNTGGPSLVDFLANIKYSIITGKDLAGAIYQPSS